MALNELHARRLATVVTLIENALDRMGLVLRALDHNTSTALRHPPFTAAQIRQLQERMGDIRCKLKKATTRFAVKPERPEPRQLLMGELSVLWVVLENAKPHRMKGYGKQLAPADRSDWEELIQGLLDDVEEIRRIALVKKGGD